MSFSADDSGAAACGDTLKFFECNLAGVASAGLKKCAVGGAEIDCFLWVWFDVVGAPGDRIDVHDVGRTDVDAFSAAVATRHINKSGHNTNDP